VLGIAVSRLRERRATEQPSAPVQVPQPPVQLPPLAESVFNFVAAAFAAQPVTGEGSPCVVDVQMVNSVTPSDGQVGQEVTNTGSVPLVAVQVESQLSEDLDFISASSGGVVDPSTGFVDWALGGLDAGASVILNVTAAITQPGTWDNHTCAAGQDAFGTVADDCATSHVVSGVPRRRHSQRNQ
jgi:uncharacterized repeat protein (TIGR01451 family)